MHNPKNQNAKQNKQITTSFVLFKVKNALGLLSENKVYIILYVSYSLYFFSRQVLYTIFINIHTKINPNSPKL